MQRYTDGYRTLVEQGAEAVLTPEGALPVLWQGPIRQQSQLARTVQQLQVPLWLGTFLPSDQTAAYTQSLITLGLPAGEGLRDGRYDKVKLVPLGEYLPLESWLGGLLRRLSPIQSSLSPGQAQQRFQTPWGLAAVGICYEPPFTDLWRHQVAAGGQWIMMASNLDPYSETLMQQQLAFSVLRAMESDRWAIHAANTGYSSVVNPQGEVYWRSQPLRDSIYKATIYRRQTQTPYMRWGNWFVALLLAWTGIAGVWSLTRLQSDPAKTSV
jgi:apolipoprotein N-acyltransferase